MSHQQPPAAIERQYYSDEEDDFYEQGVTDAQIPLGMRQEGYGEGNFNDQYIQQQQLLLQAAVAQQQAQEAAVALSAVPEPVRKYIIYLHTTLLSANPQEIFAAYEGGWNRLTEKFYQKTEWPEADIIAPLVNNDEVFLLFYRELYYRHVYSRLQPDIDDRFHSYENYCSIFNYILNSEGPVPLDLPVQWLWDIIDEFIYQFASFTTWKGRMGRKTEEEIQLIAENPQVGPVTGEDPEEVGGEWGARPLYRMLGYFSIIGLLRVHVLLGDYTLALQMMNDVELTKKALFTRVNAAHVTVHYYVAFSYIMLRRYPDATRSLTHILYFLQRLKGYHTRGYQYDAINKQGDRMYALLAICQAISPSKIDESISSTMKEKYGEQLIKMLSGGEASLASFQELFTYASPKFLSCLHRPTTDPSCYLNTSRVVVLLYTTLSINKLAGFLGVDEEEVLESLMVLKASMRSVRRSDNDYGLIEGKEVALGYRRSDRDQTRPRFNEYFIRHTDKARTMYDQLMAQPLPIPPKPASAPSAPAVAGGSGSQDKPAWVPNIKAAALKA
ncbi:hypothetical protein H4Q26_003313 [Puccinia striiformis f. sp. tritici PST-130]|nr:hypothetical protein H4Q26_003313 [Puccinia striiformis f. sp. tritici PST-130]